MQLKVCFLVLLFPFIKISCSEILQSVSDDDLLELIREKEKLIVLFSKFIITLLLLQIIHLSNLNLVRTPSDNFAT